MGKGNDLNGCRMKPQNHFNWCKREREGKSDEEEEEEERAKEGGLTEG